LKIFLDCYPCFLQQALRAARLSKANDSQQNFILQQTLTLLQNMQPGATPPEIGYQVHRYVQDVMGNQDPYLEKKKISTQQALALYPKLRQMVQLSDDPLAAAIRISIAGNIIDFAMTDQIADLWETVERVIRQPYAIDDTAAFRAHLKSANQVLYLADNAGETVFDRVLIEVLPVPVIYVVKNQPVLNDAVMEDALAAGLDEVCESLIENGSPSTGTILPLCSESFRTQFHTAPLVIAKGQANYETLSNVLRSVFCLLQVKCPMIGEDLNAPIGSIIAGYFGGNTKAPNSCLNQQL
jgi:damage-control phosphatase, subfamily I